MTARSNDWAQKIRGSDRFLLLLGVVMLAFAITFPLAVIYRWGVLRPLAGVISLLGSPTPLVLGVWELMRYERRWRTVVAVFAAAVATAVCWNTILLLVHGRFQ